METIVTNIKKHKYDVYIGRAGKGRDGYFGNPHPIGFCKICKRKHDREDCLKEYKRYFWERINSDNEFLERVRNLEGKILGCFCKPENCHGDIIVSWLNAGMPIRNN